MTLANRFFLVGIRPVRLRDHNGGLACEVFDWKTGAFTIDNSYLSKVISGYGEVEEVDQAAFAETVKRLREERKLPPQDDT
jgi:hypothetical protein